MYLNAYLYTLNYIREMAGSTLVRAWNMIWSIWMIGCGNFSKICRVEYETWFTINTIHQDRDSKSVAQFSNVKTGVGWL